MATFTSTDPGSTYSNKLFDLGASLQTAQGINANSQALAQNQQKLLDQQTEVGLRPDLASSNPSVYTPALQQLGSIDPGAATAQMGLKAAQFSQPLQRQQAVQGALANSMRGIASSPNPADAYAQIAPGLKASGFSVPDAYDPSFVAASAAYGMDADAYAKMRAGSYNLGGAGGPSGAYTVGGGGVGSPPAGGASPSAANNNPGNLKIPGGTGFQTFSTPADGMAATEAQLVRDNTVHGLKTTAQIIGSWAPPSDGNDTASYIKQVAAAVGVDPNAPIDLTDPGTRAKFANAIYKREGAGVPGVGAAPVQTQAAAPPPQQPAQGPVPPAAPQAGGNALQALAPPPPATTPDTPVAQTGPGNPPPPNYSATPPGQVTPGDASQVAPAIHPATVAALAPAPGEPTGPHPAFTPVATTAPAAGTSPDAVHGPIPQAAVIPAGIQIPGAGVTQQPANVSITAAEDHTFAPLVDGQNKPLTDKSNSYLIGINRDTGQYAAHYLPGGGQDPLTQAGSALIKSTAADGWIWGKGANGLPQLTGQVIPGSKADLEGNQQRATQMAQINAGIDVQKQAAEAQNAASAQGPGALLTPRPGPVPLPANAPLDGIPNNQTGAHYLEQLQSDATTQMSKDSDMQEGLQEDRDNAANYIALSKVTPTGPIPGSALATAARNIGLGTTPQSSYQMLDKLSARMQISGLPKGFSRLDIPIVRAVTAAQAQKTNMNITNDSINYTKMATDDRQNAQLTARQEYAAENNGVVRGFDPMWADYNANVPTVKLVNPSDPSQGLTVNDSAPTFEQWTQLRSVNNRYQPSLAKVPDAVLQARQQPQGAPQPGPAPGIQVDQTRQAMNAPAPQPQPQAAPQPQSSPPPQAQAARPPIAPAAVQMLHEHPEWASQFDQVYGQGAASTILGQ